MNRDVVARDDVLARDLGELDLNVYDAKLLGEGIDLHEPRIVGRFKLGEKRVSERLDESARATYLSKLGHQADAALVDLLVWVRAAEEARDGS